MGWRKRFKKIRRKAVRALPSPIRKVAKKQNKLMKNPAKRLVPVKVRKSAVYKTAIRPALKIGAGALAAGLTGGSSLLVLGVGAGTSALLGGTTSEGFSLKKNVLAPAAAGFGVAQIVAAAPSISATVGGVSLETVTGTVGTVYKAKTKLDKKKAMKASRDQQRRDDAEAAAIQAEIDALDAQQPAEQKPKSKGVSLTKVAAVGAAGFFVAGPIGAAVGAASVAIIDGRGA